MAAQCLVASTLALPPSQSLPAGLLSSSRNVALSLAPCNSRLVCSPSSAIGTRRNRLAVRAEVEEQRSSPPSDSEPESTSGVPQVDKKAAARAEVERGRNTAIVTGAISVLLGVGYLVLVQLLDTRGIDIVPPPPEAFGP